MVSDFIFHLRDNLAYLRDVATAILEWQQPAIEERVAEHGRPIFGAKVKGCRHNIFHIFYSLRSNMAFGVKNPFS